VNALAYGHWGTAQSNLYIGGAADNGMNTNHNDDI